MKNAGSLGNRTGLGVVTQRPKGCARRPLRLGHAAAAVVVEGSDLQWHTKAAQPPQTQTKPQPPQTPKPRKTEEGARESREAGQRAGAHSARKLFTLSKSARR